MQCIMLCHLIMFTTVNASRQLDFERICFQTATCVAIILNTELIYSNGQIMDDALTIKTDYCDIGAIRIQFLACRCLGHPHTHVMKVRILKLGLMQQESAQAVNTLLSLNQSDITVTLLWDNHR